VLLAHFIIMTDKRPPIDGDSSIAASARIDLWPHRSLSPKGFKIVMGVLAGLMLTMGIGFFLIGAWPVIGFMGAEIGVLYLVFKLNYRSAKKREHLLATKETFRIERVSETGTTTVDELPAPWLQAKLEPSANPDDDQNHQQKLIVSSHGQSAEIGNFLHAAEKRELLPAVTAMIKNTQR
jgi:uncharacterized membrane protein